jgi:hypothetical protein
LGVFLLSLLLLSGGCGGGSSDGRAETARRSIAQETALSARLRRLRRKLHRARLDAKHERTESSRARQKSPATSHVAGASSSFERLAANLDGEVGAVIGPAGSAQAADFGGLESGSAWSTSKVPIALRALKDTGGPSGLSPTKAEQIRRALTASDNQAATALFAGLEQDHGGLTEASAAVDEVLREGGDLTTRLSTQGRGEFSSYGQTVWSLANQQRFMSSLAVGCVVGRESSEYVLDLMGKVTSDLWGLGSAGLPARWKGGWGPGVDGRYLVRQMGILYVGGREAVVTLAALPADGQFATAESMATALAQWLAKQAPQHATRPHGC